MFKKKQKNKIDLTVEEACKKYCKNFLGYNKYQALLEESTQVDSFDKAEEKLTNLKNLLNEVSQMCKSLNRVVEYGKYVLGLKFASKLVRRAYYRSQIKFSEDEYYALLQFWKYLQTKAYNLEKELNSKTSSVENG